MSNAMSPLHVALLLRGEAFRWGCGEAARVRQQEALDSHHEHLTRPLEERGHRVSVLLAYHSQCTNASVLLRRGAQHDIGVSPNQAHAVIRAVAWLELLSSTYDLLVLSRFDLTLRAPVNRWSCDLLNPRTLSIASRCKAFEKWNCTNDVLHVIPRRYFAPFVGAVGAPRTEPAAGCCFHAGCVKAGGHGCFNALVSRGVPASRISFCWPQSQNLVDVLRPNAYFELSQCADLPRGSYAARPAFKGRDGMFSSGCERGNRTGNILM